jgi:hypothetical protein
MKRIEDSKDLLLKDLLLKDPLLTTARQRARRQELVDEQMVEIGARHLLRQAIPIEQPDPVAKRHRVRAKAHGRADARGLRPQDDIQTEFKKTIDDLPTIRLRGDEGNDQLRQEN